MKKIIIFLITFIGINLISLLTVNADTFSFYEGEYINAYVVRERGGMRHYNRARVYRRSGDNQFSYCTEPYEGTNPNSIYESSTTGFNLTQEQMNRIKEVIHFGYGYGNHTDNIWHAVTQLIVWKITNNQDDFFFTDYLNGNRISTFDGYISEINSLIDDYHTIPSIANKTVDLVEGEDIILTDQNNILSKYISNNENAKINGNKLTISGLKEGNYDITLTRKEGNTSQIPLFYYASDSQNMVTVGDLDSINIVIHINIKKTAIEITKIDADTKTTTPSGEAQLIGAKYSLLDSNKKEIKELTINKDNKAVVKNLKYGKYYLQEKEPGEGYTIDNKIYEININKSKPIIKLSLENKVIEKEIEIHKNYGEENNFSSEENAEFECYNSKNELIETITTDENGIAKIILPYGKYKFKQINTKDGYKYADDFEINIIDNKKETKELYDYKIEVPDTYSKDSINIRIILLIIMELLYVKKMVFC